MTRAAAVLCACLALAGCAGFEGELDLPMYGDVTLRVPDGQGGTTDLVVPTPASIQAVLDCIHRPRDPIVPFDTCECYRMHGQVRIPEAAQCFVEPAAAAAPRDDTAVPVPLLDKLAEMKRRFADPRIYACRIAPGQSETWFLQCQIHYGRGKGR